MTNAAPVVAYQLFKVSTRRNYVWVAAADPNAARQYGFNLLDDAVEIDRLRVEAHGPCRVRVPGLVRDQTIIAELQGIYSGNRR